MGNINLDAADNKGEYNKSENTRDSGSYNVSEELLIDSDELNKASKYDDSSNSKQPNCSEKSSNLDESNSNKCDFEKQERNTTKIFESDPTKPVISSRFSNGELIKSSHNPSETGHTNVLVISKDHSRYMELSREYTESIDNSYNVGCSQQAKEPTVNTELLRNQSEYTDEIIENNIHIKRILNPGETKDQINSHPKICNQSTNFEIQNDPLTCIIPKPGHIKSELNHQPTSTQTQPDNLDMPNEHEIICAESATFVADTDPELPIAKRTETNRSHINTSSTGRNLIEIESENKSDYGNRCKNRKDVERGTRSVCRSTSSSGSSSSSETEDTDGSSSSSISSSSTGSDSSSGSSSSFSFAKSPYRVNVGVGTPKQLEVNGERIDEAISRYDEENCPTDYSTIREERPISGTASTAALKSEGSLSRAENIGGYDVSSRIEQMRSFVASTSVATNQGVALPVVPAVSDNDTITGAPRYADFGGRGSLVTRAVRNSHHSNEDYVVTTSTANDTPHTLIPGIGLNQEISPSCEFDDNSIITTTRSKTIVHSPMTHFTTTTTTNSVNRNVHAIYSPSTMIKDSSNRNVHSTTSSTPAAQATVLSKHTESLVVNQMSTSANFEISTVDSQSSTDANCQLTAADNVVVLTSEPIAVFNTDQTTPMSCQLHYPAKELAIQDIPPTSSISTFTNDQDTNSTSNISKLTNDQITLNTSSIIKPIYKHVTPSVSSIDIPIRKQTIPSTTYNLVTPIKRTTLSSIHGQETTIKIPITGLKNNKFVANVNLMSNLSGDQVTPITTSTPTNGIVTPNMNRILTHSSSELSFTHSNVSDYFDSVLSPYISSDEKLDSSRIFAPPSPIDRAKSTSDIRVTPVISKECKVNFVDQVLPIARASSSRASNSVVCSHENNHNGRLILTPENNPRSSSASNKVARKLFNYEIRSKISSPQTNYTGLRQ